MSKILIVYASTDGQTSKISQTLRQVIERQGHRVSVVSIQDKFDISVADFDKIVIGASVRYGRHSPEIVKFIEKNKTLLESRPNAFFSVNVVARKPEKSKPEDNPYLQKFLQRIAWKPKLLAVFAGRLDYPSCRAIDRFMIRLIMWMTKGPTDPTTIVEYTDWEQVDSFGRTVCDM